MPLTNDEKRAIILRHGAALWDTIESCKREGAADNKIRDEVPNDIALLVAACPKLSAVFLNGSTAFNYYKKYHAGQINLPYFLLPSTSPANARCSFDKKLNAWKVAAKYIL